MRVATTVKEEEKKKWRVADKEGGKENCRLRKKSAIVLDPSSPPFLCVQEIILHVLVRGILIFPLFA